MSKGNEKKFILIDSHALIHRAFHALPELTTKKGERVNAVYGFVSILLRVLKELKPDYVAAAFDLPQPTFRHKEFASYQATRVKAPDELYQQIVRVKQILAAFRIPVFEEAGFEADDVIGSLALRSEKEKPDFKNIIVTGDLDTLQLISKKTAVFTLKKGVKDTVLYDEKAVFERYGLKPEQMPDFKGLKGDPSDNIPGVPGIGEKTACSLMKEFGTLENLYGKIESKEKKGEKIISESLKTKLLENKDQAFFSKYLATIKRDVAFKVDWEGVRFGDYDEKAVADILKELEFFSLINRVVELKGVSSGLEPEKIKMPVVDQDVFDRLAEAKEAGILSDKIYEIEKKLVPVIDQMQKNGVKVDLRKLEELNQNFTSRISVLEKEIHEMTGVVFNVNSPAQLAEILFNKLQLKAKGLKKTPGKVVSTAAPELLKLKGSHPIIDLILEHRELSKLKSTYAEALPELIDPADQRIHTQYDQLGATTGRLSSRRPNLQNIPIKTELGNEIRKCFIAEEGNFLLSADYSQLELRVVASLAGDKKMIQILKEGRDIHRATAAEVFGIAPEEVTDKMRNSAKALNFGVIYGMSIHGFSEASGFERAKAKDFVDRYFEEFRGVAEYIEKTKTQVARDGYVETIFGRKRFLPEINSSAWNLKAAAERAAVNFPVQGAAADLMKMAMIKAGEVISGQEQDIRMLLQVHDELIFEVKKEKVDEMAPKIKEAMESVWELPAPLVVKIEIGKNWGELEKWKK
ncbi:MAG: DNA polymerase [Candidatus Portnoybacteria bacterium]|nr:DNA polymerase [Candidatus Portnoybacteria bacterium]